MEILLLIAIGIAALFFVFQKLNKEPSFGSHPLDPLSKSDSPVVQPLVNNKTGDIVDVTPVVKRTRKVNPQITDAVTQTAVPVKKERKTRTPTVAKASAKTPVKAAAITAVKKTPGRKPKKVV